MKIEEQVLSIEQMKYLQELGVDTSDASMCWLRYDVGGVVKQFVEINDIKDYEWSYATQYPTYTIGDLIRKLPSSLKNEWLSSFLSISTDGYDEPFYSVCYEEEFNNIKGRQTGERVEDALYNLLCWVAENHKELLEMKK